MPCGASKLLIYKKPNAMPPSELDVVSPGSLSPGSTLKPFLTFALTIILGYALFIVPNVFFGITKVNGGLQGINLLLMALFQCASIIGLLTLSLKKLGQRFRDIGWSRGNGVRDAGWGIIAGGSWAALQFALIIPATGGAERADIVQMVDTMDGTGVGLLSYLALGVIGGGITEELFNRGYFISVLQSIFNHSTLGTWIASLTSIFFFALGHLPTDTLAWFDILVPTVVYTLLFLRTQRLTAPIVAHSVYNASAIVSIYLMYYPR